MPDYRRKKHGFSDALSKKKPKKNNGNFSVKMQPSKIQKQDTAAIPKVIKGKKLTAKAKIRSLVIIGVVLVLIAGLMYLIFPAGITESLSDAFLSIGSGKYPISVLGTQIVSVESESNSYYVLTDSNVYNINNSGSVIDTYYHGFSDPVLKISNTRALIYGQGQNNFVVRRTKHTVFEKSTDNPIIAADVSNSGVFAVATLSNDYASTLYVYDKNGNNIYKWNCAKDIINSICLSQNGKKIAVSTVNSNVEKLSSKVHIFNFSDTDSESTFDYTDCTVYSLKSNSKGFFVITNQGYDFYNWKNKSKSENKSDFHISMFRCENSGAITVLNRESDYTDNIINYISPKGVKENEFSFKGNISDIRLLGSHIYIISEANVYIFDKTGKQLFSEKCDFDEKYLIVTGSQSVDMMSDNTIKKIKIKN